MFIFVKQMSSVFLEIMGCLPIAHSKCIQFCTTLREIVRADEETQLFKNQNQNSGVGKLIKGLILLESARTL